MSKHEPVLHVAAELVRLACQMEHSAAAADRYTVDYYRYDAERVRSLGLELREVADALRQGESKP